MMGGEREIFMEDPRRAKEGMGAERKEKGTAEGRVLGEERGGRRRRWRANQKNVVRNEGDKKAGAQRECEGRGRPEKERWAG